MALEPPRCADAIAKLDAAYRDVRGSVDVMLDTLSVNARLTHTGVVSGETARQLGMVGVAARASGVAADARLCFPLSDAATGIKTRTCTTGDVLGRTLVRNMELDDSAAQARADLGFLQDSPGDDTPAPLPDHLPASRLCVAQTEGWRGEVCHIAVTDSSGAFLTYKIIDPSFHNWIGLSMALRNEQISDFPLCNKSFNLSYCGHDL